MRILVIALALVAAGAVWTKERIVTAGLRGQIDLTRQQGAELDSLRMERDRLQSLQPTADELARLRHEAAERARANAVLVGREAAGKSGRPATLAVGEWLPPGAWKNRGQTTPTATVETLLWAAAGGDVARLKDLLQLGDVVRAKAEAILARLPDGSREFYATPEHLVAAFTAKAVPVGDAQLVWQHQSGPDEAVACVWVQNSEAPTAFSVHAARSRAPNDPPMAPENPKTSATYLSLQRSEAGWRIVVPSIAIDKIAQELAGAPAR